MAPQPTLTNFRMRGIADARYVAELASVGRLRAAGEYLRSKDQDTVSVGHVYAFRTVPGLRWSDGLRSKTDPSSTHRTEFLTYPIPHPPNRAGVHPSAAWVRKRKTFTITRADGILEEWEIAAYDYDKPVQDHGAHFRTLDGGIDDLLLPGAADDAAASHPVTLAGPGVLPGHPLAPDASTLLVDTAPRGSPAPSSWSQHPTSPVTSPVVSRRLPAMRLFRSPSPLPALAPRYHPYATRRSRCDDEMLGRFSGRRWLARGR